MVLSVVIPSRNEIHLQQTVESVLNNAVGDLDVIVILDGWDETPTSKIPQQSIDLFKPQQEWVRNLAGKDGRIRLLEYKTPVGQRIGINKAVDMTKGEIYCKIDAHSIMPKGWDKLWLNGYRCNALTTTSMCGITEETWTANDRVFEFSLIDNQMKSLWWTRYVDKVNPSLAPTMSFLGTTWMISKKLWKELGCYDESLYVWGESGTEISCKLWLSGHEVLLNRDLVIGHLYRKHFPYHISGKSRVDMAKQIRNIFFNDQWDKQVHRMAWLVGKFSPVPTWDKTIFTETEIRGRF